MIQGEYVENVKIMSAEIQNGKLSKKVDPVVTAGRNVANSDSLKALTKICKYTKSIESTYIAVQFMY
jgi:hypothetical protein